MSGPSKAELIRIIGAAGFFGASCALGYAFRDYFIRGGEGKVVQISNEIRAGWSGVRAGVRTLLEKRGSVDSGEDSSLR